MEDEALELNAPEVGDFEFDEDVDFFAIFLASAARVADDGDPTVSLAELSVDDFAAEYPGLPSNLCP